MCLCLSVCLFVKLKLITMSDTEKLFVLVRRFINARRRIVQPMIDQSNRAGKYTDLQIQGVAKSIP